MQAARPSTSRSPGGDMTKSATQACFRTGGPLKPGFGLSGICDGLGPSLAFSNQLSNQQFALSS